jgi:hypothetical protein
MRLRPDPTDGKASSDAERKLISRYFLDELTHHVRAAKALEGHAALERELLSTFSFLQSQLDWELD